MGPRTDPCGTPESISSQELKKDPILTHCFRWFQVRKKRNLKFWFQNHKRLVLLPKDRVEGNKGS